MSDMLDQTHILNVAVAEAPRFRCCRRAPGWYLWCSDWFWGR